LHQQPQQLLFRLAELHRNAVPGELHPAEIEGEAVQLHPFRLGGGGPAQLSIHPGPQHRQREGLGDIVIRPQLQTCHDVCLQVIGSQQDYGNLTLPPEGTEEVQSIAVRQVDVQDQQVEAPAGEQLPGIRQGPAELGAELRRLEGQADTLAQSRVILHDQQVFHRGTSLGSNCAQYTTGGRRRPERAEETHGGQAAVRGSRD
ncbi:Peptidase E, partial [Dysosmobacter welbionis]